MLRHSTFPPGKTNILITGGCGLIGGELYKRLSQNPNYAVYVFDRGQNHSGRAILDEVNQAQVMPVIAGQNYMAGDITNPEDVARAIQQSGAQVIYHLAGLLEHEQPEEIMRVNTQGLENILAACEQSQQVKAIVNASSVMLYWQYINDEPFRTLFYGTPEERALLPEPLKKWPEQIDFNQDKLCQVVSDVREQAYILSKYLGEQSMARFAAANPNIACYSARLGWVRYGNKLPSQPALGKLDESSIWCSIEDCCSALAQIPACTPAVISTVGGKNHILNIISANRWCPVELSQTEELLSWKPKDSVEQQRAQQAQDSISFCNT